MPIEVYTDESSVPLRDLIGFGLVNRSLGGGEEALFFTHQSFQEFLAAKHAAKTPDAVDQIIRERWNPKWAETIRFLAGLRGEQIVEKILAEPENVIHSNLFLASGCASQVATLSAARVTALRTGLYALTGTGNYSSLRRRAFQSLCEVHHRFDIEDQELILNWLRSAGERNNTDTGQWWLDPHFSDADRIEFGRENEQDSIEHDSIAYEGGERLLRAWGAPNGAEALHVMVGWLSDKHWYVRYASLKALQSFGAQIIGDFLSVIVARLNDDVSSVRYAARVSSARNYLFASPRMPSAQPKFWRARKHSLSGVLACWWRRSPDLGHARLSRNGLAEV